MSDFHRTGPNLAAAMSSSAAEQAPTYTHVDHSNSRTSVIIGGSSVGGVVVDRNDTGGVSGLVQAAQLERLTIAREQLVEKLGRTTDADEQQKLQRLIEANDSNFAFQEMVGSMQLQKEAKDREAQHAQLIKEIEMSKQIAAEKELAALRKKLGG